ncbi:MAG TPA: Rieske (2Fe-2S) protein [Chitinophagaceae bacterium]
MDRNEFIKQCGFACLGAIGISTIVQSCSPATHLNAFIADNRLVIPLSAFELKKRSADQSYRRYIVARNEQLNYPLVVYRDNENDYTALLLRCSHQYNELNVNGELLSCPAHGSEFDTRGNVVNGPANEKLRSFSITKDGQNLYIQLA